MNEQQGMIPPDDEESVREIFRLAFENQEREADNPDDSEALWNATGRG
jgi:hypothetical protein